VRTRAHERGKPVEGKDGDKGEDDDEGEDDEEDDEDDKGG
jgi:hypothetical protein